MTLRGKSRRVQLLNLEIPNAILSEQGPSAAQSQAASQKGQIANQNITKDEQA